MKITKTGLNNSSILNFSTAHSHKKHAPKNTTIPKNFDPYADGYHSGMMLKKEYLETNEDELSNKDFELIRRDIIKIAQTGYPKRKDCDQFVRGFENGFNELGSDDPYDFYWYTRNGQNDKENARLCYTQGELFSNIEIPKDYEPRKNPEVSGSFLDNIRHFFLNFKR